jgi:hypothetical protein
VTGDKQQDAIGQQLGLAEAVSFFFFFFFFFDQRADQIRRKSPCRS